MRASSAPRLKNCQAWVNSPLPAVSVPHGVTSVGNEAHLALKTYVDNGMDLRPDVSGEVEPLLENGIALLAKLNIPEGATIYTELTVGFGELTGHLDFCAENEHFRIIVDYKAGFKDGDYEWQVRGYAKGMNFFERKPTKTYIFWLQDGTVQEWKWTPEELDRWYAEYLLPLILSPSPTYTIGNWCGYCPIKDSCPGRIARDQGAIAVLGGGMETIGKELSDPVRAIALYERLKSIESALEIIRDAFREHLKGGAISDGTTEYYLLEANVRELDLIKAWGSLVNWGLSKDEIASICKPSISKAEKLVGDKAGKGNGAGAIRSLAEELKNAGAISYKPQIRIQSRKAK